MQDIVDIPRMAADLERQRREIERLRAENQRLREALRKIALDDYTSEDERLTSNVPTMIWQVVARQALCLK